MSDQRDQQSFIGLGSIGAVLRPLIVLAAIAATISLVVLAWGGAGAATGEVQMRIFLVGWAIAAVVVLAGFLFPRPVPDPEQRAIRLAPFLAAQHVAVGVVLGLAIGTTDWAALRLVGWWQLWWTVPLLLAYIGHLVTLRKSSRTRP